MRLLLLRHGQTHGNAIGALDTAYPGADLTDLGIQQAESAALALADRGITGIYTSALVRTGQTGAPLAEALGLEPVTLEGLREISAGDYEMATDEDSILGYVGTVADWIERRLDKQMSGAETGHEFLARYDDAVARIAADGHEVALLVSHGAAIRTWVSNRVTDSETHEMATQGFNNTACIELDGDPASGWSVVSWVADPIGGAYLEDETAPDPTGADLDEV
ncbi:broad specificity phosphatase PhoE [Marmoricola sp. OAE513]|uniref:histidine phosphatase family protein n=1 Tax=Marmoricola sp. OAE513 TaxID=2817894 RepID=UPI001AE52568